MNFFFSILCLSFNQVILLTSMYLPGGVDILCEAGVSTLSVNNK